MAAWPLVGRDRELNLVDELLADPDARGVVLAGPAGVGKTHLARTIVERTGDPSALFVRATRAASAIPLGAFAPYLPTDLGEGDEGVRLRRATVALAALTEGSDHRPIICVDDAHALDQSSAALLFQLALDGRMFLLVVLRSDDDAANLLVELWKDELPRVDLRSFDEPEVGAILETALAGQVEQTTAHALFEASGGNVLYLRELVNGLLAAGTLNEESGLWRLTGPITASARLTELLAHRLRDLEETERLLLDIVALGEPIGVTHIEREGWGDAQESLERKGLVVTERSERRWRVRLAHPLYGEIARDQLTERRRRQLLRQLADTIAATGMRRRDDKRRVALWMLETGDTPDPDVLVVAARDALVGSDLPGVERLARAALDAGAGAPAAHILGRALDGMGRFEDAEALLAGAELQATDPEQRTLLALARADNLFRGLARPDDAEAVLVAAEGEITDVELRARLVAQRAVHAAFEGRVADGLALTEPLLSECDGVAFCEVALPASGGLRTAGRLGEAIRLVEEALHVRRSLDAEVQAPAPAIFLVSRAMSLAEYGGIDEARAASERAYNAAVRANFTSGIGWLALSLATAELAAGKVQTAARLARQSAVAFGSVEHPGARWGFELLAVAAGHIGDVETAAAAMADFDAEPDTAISVTDREAPRGRAWLAAARGELQEARRILRDAADRAREKQIPLFEAQVLFDYARLGDPAPVAERIFELAEVVDGPLTAARTAFVRAYVDDDPAALDAASRALEECGARLLAAEAVHEAARRYRAAGDTRAATAATNRARSLADLCEGARTPLLELGETTVALSRREQEVAALAARGKTNREIADALFVSTRTVENHLQRVYEKLGIRGRDELPNTLEPPS